ncbi:MAG: hypothetical protein FWD57_06215 [Polyangiaceae bacterium]|nr:hypothetical protein [Polyangiaceae bacterium]
MRSVYWFLAGCAAVSMAACTGNGENAAPLVEPGANYNPVETSSGQGIGNVASNPGSGGTGGSAPSDNADGGYGAGNGSGYGGGCGGGVRPDFTPPAIRFHAGDGYSTECVPDNAGVCASDPSFDGCFSCLSCRCLPECNSFYSDPYAEDLLGCFDQCHYSEECFDQCSQQFPATDSKIDALGVCMVLYCGVECGYGGFCNDVTTGNQACDACFMGNCSIHCINPGAEGIVSLSECYADCSEKHCFDSCTEQFPAAENFFRCVSGTCRTQCN